MKDSPLSGMEPNLKFDSTKKYFDIGDPSFEEQLRNLTQCSPLSLYYSDSAIRERCVKMAVAYEIAIVGKCHFGDKIIAFAERLFQYVKEGLSATDGDNTQESQMTPE